MKQIKLISSNTIKLFYILAVHSIMQYITNLICRSNFKICSPELMFKSFFEKYKNECGFKSEVQLLNQI